VNQGRGEMDAHNHSSRSRWALSGALIGIAVIIAIPGYVYFQQVIAPGNKTVVSIDGRQVLSTNDLVRAVVVGQMLIADPTDLSGLGPAPYLVADAALNAALLRAEATARGVTVSRADIDAVVQARFRPASQVGDDTLDAELDRLYREAYTRFLAERGVNDSEYRHVIEQALLRDHVAATMPGGTAELDEWLSERRNDQQAEVNLNSAVYAWVLDEVRASLPRNTTNQQEQQ
jgi:hypothetical protein